MTAQLSIENSTLAPEKGRPSLRSGPGFEELSNGSLRARGTCTVFFSKRLEGRKSAKVFFSKRLEGRKSAIQYYAIRMYDECSNDNVSLLNLRRKLLNAERRPRIQSHSPLLDFVAIFEY